MKDKTKTLLAEIAKLEEIDMEDLLSAVSGRIKRLSKITKANKGQFQIYFIDHDDHEGGTLQCYRPNEKEALEEQARLTEKLEPGTTCEYYVRSPAGYLIRPQKEA